jgi:hypothetical protein
MPPILIPYQVDCHDVPFCGRFAAQVFVAMHAPSLVEVGADFLNLALVVDDNVHIRA